MIRCSLRGQVTDSFPMSGFLPNRTSAWPVRASFLHSCAIS